MWVMTSLEGEGIRRRAPKATASDLHPLKDSTGLSLARPDMAGALEQRCT
jgi:hypothetical protein